MKTRTKSVQADESMDDIPLINIANGGLGLSKIQSIRHLRRHSIQLCEFCETRCKNRYNMFVHNSKHIIIPLIRQTPLHCPECGTFCISDEHLENHTTVRHRKSSNPYNGVNNKEASQINTTFKEGYIKDDLINGDLCDPTAKLLGGAENILKNFMMQCKVDLEKIHPSRPFNIKHEDNVQYIINSSPEPSSDPSSADDPISLSMNANGVVKSDVEDYESVHYDDLIKPTMFVCSRCVQRFPNRYEAIIHEVVHMDLTKAICKKIKKRKRMRSNDHVSTDSAAGKELDLKTHCQKQTKNGAKRRSTSHKKYSCTDCGKGYNYSKPLARHMDECQHNSGRVLNMCDACLFTSQKRTVEYTCIGRLTNLAVKQRCTCCGKCFHEVTLVKPTQKKWRIADRIQFEENRSMAGRPPKHRRKKISNSSRLKLIQNRIKFINKYN